MFFSETDEDNQANHTVFETSALGAISKIINVGTAFNSVILINPLPPSDAVRKQKKKTISEDPFSSVLSHFKKYHTSGNLKFNNLGIFQSLKLRTLIEKSFQYLVS